MDQDTQYDYDHSMRILNRYIVLSRHLTSFLWVWDAVFLLYIFIDVWGGFWEIVKYFIFLWVFFIFGLENGMIDQVIKLFIWAYLFVLLVFGLF